MNTGGVVPALLTNLKSRFSLSYMQQGALGSIMYLMSSIACPLNGYLLQRHSAKTIIFSSLLLNALATLVFACTPTGASGLLLFSRAIVGFSQASLMVWYVEYNTLQSIFVYILYIYTYEILSHHTVDVKGTCITNTYKSFVS